MTIVGPNLFKGVAVVIDNGIDEEESITQILDNIAKSGGHTIKLKEIPGGSFDLEHFSNAAFFVMDWNLLNGDDGKPLPREVTVPQALKKEMVARNIEFLKRLSKSRHAPVFIFTNEDTGEVEELLAAHEDLSRGAEESHILVKSKSDVLDKVYEVLEEWGNARPSVVTLKTWEKTLNKAANELFVDLHNKTPFWPVVFWQTFDADGVPQSSEMMRLLNRLVESRLGTPDLDLSSFGPALKQKQDADEAQYLKSVHMVLEGERFLRDARLEKGAYAPGDLFLLPNEKGPPSYYMNIRPECDCIRGGDDHELYLLKVREVDPVINEEFGAITDELHNEAIVFAMLDGKTFSIKFKDIKVKKLKALRDYRVGRLLAPFVTRVQQRYSTYLQRPGLPRVPPSLIKVPESNAVAAE